ncbi:MAG: hypothetical protein M0R28_12640 [Pigmentiphaga sp.]|nr:hypothetical protein [Pigmentiphaga sp.]
MSAPGRPKREPSLGEEVAKRPEGSPVSAPGRPKREPSLGEEVAKRPEGSPVSAAGVPRDQAAGLRSLMARQAPRLIAVREAEGLDGTAQGLAWALSRQGHEVLVVGARQARRLRRWPAGAQQDEALPVVAPLPASLGELMALPAVGKASVVLVEAPAAEEALGLADQAPEALIVLPGNDGSGVALTTAYAALKHWHLRYPGIQHRVLVADVDSEARAYGVFCRLATVAARYLTVKLSFVGYLPAVADPASPVRLRAFERIALNLPRWHRI